MPAAITPFLMFEGRCEEAVNFYVSIFEDSAITRLDRHGDDAPKPGQVLQAWFRLGGREFRAFDSPVAHAFTFTPALSIFVDCRDEAELERLYGELLEGGGALMPLGDYGFSRRFGWVNDRFGVSWQLNLPHA
ncbi:VOC family protein [Phenylobacterium sp. J367]|uniref:VOC family protein n=1 Tax=Phenylobacterium sp. J367 TaxID=2898435 RepID=UPI0021515B2E|nr:VOC family protein [Phenylobacterium sp. J367]MCR5878847.1 VOC family protein [Phenylobacterium sp. J367]